MLASAENKFTTQVGRPACKCSCGFLNIMLRIITPAQGKQLHYFPGKIFVGMVFPVLLVIQEIQHCCCFRNVMKHIPKASICIPAQRIQQTLLVKNIQVAACKMSMPEKSKFFP